MSHGVKITVPIPEGDNNPEDDVLKKHLGNPIGEEIKNEQGSIGSPVFTNDMKKNPAPKTLDQLLDDDRLALRSQGQQLIQAALHLQRQKFNSRLVDFVAGTIRQVGDLEDQRDQLGKCIQLLKGRLSAINDGKFKADDHGNVTFEDDSLNYGTPAQVEKTGKVFIPLPSFNY